MKRCLSMVIVVALILLSVLSGCSKVKVIDKDNIYYFPKYQSEELTDIEQVELGGELSDSCVSYKFLYRSDGYWIDGYLSIPWQFIYNESPGKCILYNRGGNSRIGLLSDEDTARICAETNRIVVASQYRGAAGGQGRDEFGGDDMNDVIKLIDLCEKHFAFVDMEDFCTIGVSRGGMMSYLAARQDERIKRIMAVSAVSDLFKSYEEREDMQQLLENCIGASPEEASEEYEKRSAVYWADEIVVPVLIIHSKDDERVPFAQAQAMYDKLKLNNEDVSFVARDDSLHGLSMENADVISDWLDN